MDDHTYRFVEDLHMLYYFDETTNDWWPDNFMEPDDYDTVLQMLKYLPEGTMSAIVPL
jgi:hypothetical protein